MMISRSEAVNVLEEIIDADILNDRLQLQLENIKNCINEERYCRHIWGANEDWIKLHVAYRSDLITDELNAELNAIADKHTFSPAPYEKAEEEAEEEADV